ncbi:MAG: serine/threonine-protein kinase [Kofleriaceae bacterium]|nr:serine/threonine-protein kinase [Kofleriaceae bacterium]
MTDVCPGEETVAAYVAGQLARRERDTFELHLDACSACHELLAALGKAGVRKKVPLGSVTSLGAAGPDELPAMTWSPGEQLGRYVLLAQLGSGGMGVVYAAYDPELDRKVALKLLHRSDDTARERLRDEARAIAKLAHPNVVAVHDVGEAGDEVFVAMEHVDGETLRDWLEARRTPAEILRVFVDAARGLAAAHAVGLVHRDVKPSNRMIGKDGRARVLDFGLARARVAVEGETAGTPAYMAPEQQQGGRVDARADQFALCVALWEALAGERPRAGTTASVQGVPERVVRALRRGLAVDPAARFATLDELILELSPRSRGRRWVIATFVVGALLSAALIVVLATREAPPPSCAHAGDPMAQRWSDAQRAEVRAAFARTNLPYAATAVTEVIAQLDAWSARWQDGARASCQATLVERVQPPELHANRQACLDQLLERMQPVIALATTADRALVARASSLVAGVPSPERCRDASALLALAPLPPGEGVRADAEALRARIATAEAAILAGRSGTVIDEVTDIAKRATALDHPPLVARAHLLVSRLEQARAHYEESIAASHTAARAATAARDLELLAEIWIDLTQTLGNDLRTLDQADVFDGYAAALVQRLPDGDDLLLQLEFARCNRNNDASKSEDNATLAKHCETAIAHAERVKPPRLALANASRSRLGHFQRLMGRADDAHATLLAAVDQSLRIHGPGHPDTAVARYSLGIAELAANRLDEAITQLREALAIRRAAFPGASIQVAESLQGLGDAIAVKGDHREAVTLLEEALTMLDQAGEADSAQAANCHILVGMSLEEVQRHADAGIHYLRAADIADRALQHREGLAAMALRLATEIAVRDKQPSTGVAHLERAVRLLERGKAPPVELGRTQVRLAELLFELGPADRPRARAMVDAARGNFVIAGEPAAAQLAAVEAFMKKQGWR